MNIENRLKTLESIVRAAPKEFIYFDLYGKAHRDNEVTFAYKLRQQLSYLSHTLRPEIIRPIDKNAPVPMGQIIIPLEEIIRLLLQHPTEASEIFANLLLLSCGYIWTGEEGYYVLVTDHTMKEEDFDTFDRNYYKHTYWHDVLQLEQEEIMCKSEVKEHEQQ
jgi:hypothetical protein